MQLNKISGIITTLNEAINIEECIISLKKVCTEIIVVDSGSNDNTIETAKKLGAIVIHQQYLGDGIQKNIALNYVSNDWVLSLDADERLTVELIEIINNIKLSNTNYYGFAVRRRNYVGNRWLKCCNWYPDYLVRLYNHKKIKFPDTKQHAKIDIYNCKKLKGDLIHYRYHNTGELFAKPERNYSTRSAKIMLLNGKKVTVLAPVFHSLWSFILNYLFRKGIFYGIDGLSLSISIALNTYLKYTKLIEYKRDKTVFEKEDFTSVW